MKPFMQNRQAGFTLLELIVALIVAGIAAAMVSAYFGSSLTQSGVPISRLQTSSDLIQVMERIVADYNRLNAINLRYHWVPSVTYTIDSVVTPQNIPATPNGNHLYICTAGGSSGSAEPSWPTATGGIVTESGGPTWKEYGNIVWQKGTYYGIGAKIVPITNTGHFYKCVGAGTSGPMPPELVPLQWPVLTGGTLIEPSGGPTWQEAGTILQCDTAVNESLKDYLDNHPNRYGTSYSVLEATFVQFTGTSLVAAGTSGTSSEKNILKVTIKSSGSNEMLTQLFTLR